MMPIKLSESLSIGCLVSPLDHADILAQEAQMESLREELRMVNIRNSKQEFSHDLQTLKEDNTRMRYALEFIVLNSGMVNAWSLANIAKEAMDLK